MLWPIYIWKWLYISSTSLCNGLVASLCNSSSIKLFISSLSKIFTLGTGLGHNANFLFSYSVNIESFLLYLLIYVLIVDNFNEWTAAIKSNEYPDLYWLIIISLSLIDTQYSSIVAERTLLLRRKKKLKSGLVSKWKMW